MRLRSLLARASTIAAVFFVLTAYAFFASQGTFEFRREPWQLDGKVSGTDRFYAGLAESFLHGRIDLPYPVSPRWALVNPYDQESRATQSLQWEMWDASLFRGRFYLYFSPLPVLLFYIPFRLIAGAYPPSSLAAFWFASWAFLASVAFARRALRESATHVPFPIWVLLLGVANLVPFTLTFARAYEVAIATGMAMTASWAYALLRWMESRQPRRAVWMSLWLALAIAARPNLLVLLPVTAFALFVTRDRRAFVLAMIPLAVVGGALAAYNYARFGSLVEFGMTYQITVVPVWRMRPCSLCDVPDVLRFFGNVFHYASWPPRFRGEFPFIDLQWSAMDLTSAFPVGPEQIGGIAVLSPLTFAATAVGIVLALRRGALEPRVRAAVFVLGGAWLVMLGLSTCRFVTARYSLDFALLMTMASVVCAEYGLTLLARSDVRVRAVAAIVTAAACVSILMGVLLGFRGPDGILERKNPKLFERFR
jgi:hypothetical protein